MSADVRQYAVLLDWPFPRLMPLAVLVCVFGGGVPGATGCTLVAKNPIEPRRILLVIFLTSNVLLPTVGGVL